MLLGVCSHDYCIPLNALHHSVLPDCATVFQNSFAHACSSSTSKVHMPCQCWHIPSSNNDAMIFVLDLVICGVFNCCIFPILSRNDGG